MIRSTRVRTGLVLAALLSVGNIVSVLQPTPAGEVGPPFVVLLVGAVLGLAGLAAVVVAWRRGSRVALRVASGVVVATMLTAVPAFFVGVPVGVKAMVGAVVLASVLAVVLMLAPAGRTPAPQVEGAIR